MNAIDIKVKSDCDVEEPFLATQSGANNGLDIVVGSCPKCAQTFKTRHGLLAHKLKCNPNTKRKVRYNSSVSVAKKAKTPIKLFACDICAKLYYTKQGLDKHKETFHKIGPGATPSSCPHCPKTFPNTVRLQSHILACHRRRESSLSCSQCNAKFVEENFLALHIRTNKCESEPYKCSPCELDFEYKCSWKRHLKTCNKLPLTFPCTFPNCTRAFTTKRKLDAHYFHAHPSPKPPPPPCPECGKQFSSKSGLQKHRRTHDPELKHRKFNCSYCNRKFINLIQLRNHERFARGETTDNKHSYCTQCLTNFSFKCQYIAHVVDQECPKCQLHFTCTTKYVEHNCEGTPGPWAGGYPCVPCSKIFPKFLSWRIHSYIHYREVIGKKYTCLEPGCGKWYTSSNCLRRHRIETHSNLKKKKKPRNFKLKYKFVRLANGSLSFPCPEPGCNKTFKATAGLTQHQQSAHIGQRYACKHCGLLFTQKNNLSRHEKVRTCFKKKRKSRSQNESFHKLEPEVQVKSRGTIKSKTPVPSKVGTFSCESCHQTFGREISLQRHLKLNQDKNTNGRTCEFCSTKFDLECGLQLHIKNQFTCSNSKCNFITNCELSYTKHKVSCVNVFFPENEVKTESENFEDKLDYSFELSLDPGGPFYCWACGQLEFNLRTSFYNHIRIVHGQEPE